MTFPPFQREKLWQQPQWLLQLQSQVSGLWLGMQAKGTSSLTKEDQKRSLSKWLTTKDKKRNLHRELSSLERSWSPLSANVSQHHSMWADDSGQLSHDISLQSTHGSAVSLVIIPLKQGTTGNIEPCSRWQDPDCMHTTLVAYKSQDPRPPTKWGKDRLIVWQANLVWFLIWRTQIRLNMFLCCLRQLWNSARNAAQCPHKNLHHGYIWHQISNMGIFSR